MQKEITQQDNGGDDFLFEYSIKYMELLLLVREELDLWKRKVSKQYSLLFNLYSSSLKLLLQKMLSEVHLEQVVATGRQGADKELSTGFNAFSAKQGISEEYVVESYNELSGCLKHIYDDLGMTDEKFRAEYLCEAYCKEDSDDSTLCPFCSAIQKAKSDMNRFAFNQVRLRKGISEFSISKRGYVKGENLFVQISLAEKEWEIIEDEFFLQGQYLEDFFEKLRQIFPRRITSVNRCCQLLKQMWLHKKVLSLYSPC